MKPSHQVSYDMRLPLNKKIPVKDEQYIQGTPWGYCGRSKCGLIEEGLKLRLIMQRQKKSYQRLS
jgi:hypothetical protein